MGLSDAPCIPCFGCIFLIAIFVGTVFSWKFLVEDMKFYQNQAPAMCVDARLREDPYVYNTTNVFVVESGMKKTGAIDMICYYYTAVYYCHDEDIDASDWSGQCVNLAKFPSPQPMQDWPKVQHNVVECFKKETLGADHCVHHNWDCSGNACTANQKALHVCWQKHRPDPYPCFSIRGDSSAGIREEATAFPTLWFVGFLVSIVVLLGICLGCVGVSTAEDRDSPKYRCASSCCALILYLFILIMACFVYQPPSPEEDDGIAPPRSGLTTGELFLVIFGALVVLASLFICLFHIQATCQIFWYVASKSKALWSRDLSLVVQGSDAGVVPLGWRIYDLVKDDVVIRTKGTRVRAISSSDAMQNLCYRSAVGWWPEKDWACDKVGTVLGSDRIGPGVRAEFQKLEEVPKGKNNTWKTFSLPPEALYLESADVASLKSEAKSHASTNNTAGTGTYSEECYGTPTIGFAGDI